MSLCAFFFENVFLMVKSYFLYHKSFTIFQLLDIYTVSLIFTLIWNNAKLVNLIYKYLTTSVIILWYFCIPERPTSIVGGNIPNSKDTPPLVKS